MTPPPLKPRDALAAMGALPDESLDLAEGALFLAALDHPGRDLTPYRDHLTTLCHSLSCRREALMAEGGGLGAEASTVDPQTPIAQGLGDGLDAESRGDLLAEVMVGEWGYLGDSETYDDLQNADLMQVIDRRLGLPVSLGILYLHVARAQGWVAHGLNFPGHFLVRLDGDNGDRVILDPFHGGQQVQVQDLRSLLKAVSGQGAELTPDAYEPLSNRDILLRLLGNSRRRMLEAGQIDGALKIVRRMMLLTPDDHRLWREAGLMMMRLGDLESALDALDQYLSMAPAGEDRSRIEQVMSELHERLH